MTTPTDQAIDRERLHQLIARFHRWSQNNPGFTARVRNDKYEKLRAVNYWHKATDEELVEDMYQFTRDGGNIQTGGARFAAGVRESIRANTLLFRRLILELSDVDPPDIDAWWRTMRESFRYFGAGTCSILLHRLFPERYAVLNKASVIALRRMRLVTGTKDALDNNYGRFLGAVYKLIGLSEGKLDLRSADEMMHFLVNTPEGLAAWTEITGENLPDEEQRPIWAIRAGEDSAYWEQWKREGFIAVSWPDIGEAAECTTMEDFRRLLLEHYPKKDSDAETDLTHRNNAKALDDFINNMAVGDFVVVTGGSNIILGVGRITGEYRYIPSDPSGEQERRRSVEWLITELAESHHKFPTKTLTPIEPSYHTYYEITRYMQRTVPQQEQPAISTAARNEMDRIERLLLHTPNLILYGPPGTGKTYIARQLVHHLTDETTPQEETEDVRYWWVTVSPSVWKWSSLFPDGVQVFKFGRIARNYRDVREGDLVFGYHSHPDKRICAMARVKAAPVFDPDGKPQQEMVLEPYRMLDNPLLWRDLAQDPIMKNSEPLRNGAQGTLFRITNDEAQHLLSLVREVGNDLGGVSMNKVKRYEFVTFHQSYFYEQFVEGLSVETDDDGQTMYRVKDGVFKRIARRAQADPDGKYVLVIDEINRGNISKIFGELITLIEKDKRMETPSAGRSGQKGIEVTLPYSGESFCVPANLRIVGTMNSADRSIALLDVALRRRFIFEELAPVYDPEVWRESHGAVKIEGVDLPLLLKALNSRIMERLNREYRIGHAYLMGLHSLTDLRYKWFYSIVPLLQEYFYNDDEALHSVLGSGFVRSFASSADRRYECISERDMNDNEFRTALFQLIGKKE